MVEYIEKDPPILNSFGMCSIIKNYHAPPVQASTILDLIKDHEQKVKELEELEKQEKEGRKRHTEQAELRPGLELTMQQTAELRREQQEGDQTNAPQSLEREEEQVLEEPKHKQEEPKQSEQSSLEEKGIEPPKWFIPKLSPTVS